MQDTLSGKFVASGKQKTADVLVGKRMMSDKELKHRKKVQAGISVTTSTLGLTALGMKGGAFKAARSAGRLEKIAERATVPAGLQNRHALKAELHHRRADKLNNAAVNTSLAAGGIGGLGGYNFASYTRAEGKKRQIRKNWSPGMDFGLDGVQQGEEISKKDWKNISEHERRARDSRRTRGRAKDVAGVGATVGAGAILHGNYVGRNAFKEAGLVGRATKNTAKANWNLRGVKGPAGAQMRGGNLRALGGSMKKLPHGTALLAGYGTAAAAGGVMAGARINEKRHDHAIARQRKARVTKAYDPERNRQRRLDHWSTASAVGAGATGTGALIFGRKAAPGVKRFASTKYGKGSLKSLGAATALGVGATGLAVGSDRIRSYKKGRGRSHSPMHTIGY